MLPADAPEAVHHPHARGILRRDRKPADVRPLREPLRSLPRPVDAAVAIAARRGRPAVAASLHLGRLDATFPVAPIASGA